MLFPWQHPRNKKTWVFGLVTLVACQSTHICLLLFHQTCCPVTPIYEWCSGEECHLLGVNLVQIITMHL
jgi:hypothetical protein